METVQVAAVDLGASSGRVILGAVGPDRLDLTEVVRFPNRPVRLGETLHWDVLALWAGAMDGLRAAARRAGRLDGIGIDSWAVDYGLLDRSGELLGNPVHYRDDRTQGVADRTQADLGAEWLYDRNGLQHLPFNTIYQLVAARGTTQLEAAERLLMMPDLFNYWLTGVQATEVTNASTTGLLDARSRTWSKELVAASGIDPDLLAPLQEPGDLVGSVTAPVLAELGLPGPVAVWAVGSHDTASAVVGVPADTDRFAYISCGTWSLIGLELDAPVLTPDSRRANFTNELGVDGTVRYLRNVMGLWLLQECLRTWAAAGTPADLPALLEQAARRPAFTSLVDPDHPVFLPPGDMPMRIAHVCRESGQPAPADPAATVRCILDSLALAYRRAVVDAQRLSGREVEVIHLVGGGANNALLCQLTADACGLQVQAGPVESAALGNILVQARALGRVADDLPALRRLLRSTQKLRLFTPDASRADWAAAAERVPWHG